MNPFELGTDRPVDLDIDGDFIGRSAPRRVREEGPRRLQVGLEITGPRLAEPNDEHWPVRIDGQRIGTPTPAAYSPRPEQSIALAPVERARAATGTSCEVLSPEEPLAATVVPKPFHDPGKRLATARSPARCPRIVIRRQTDVSERGTAGTSTGRGDRV